MPGIRISVVSASLGMSVAMTVEFTLTHLPRVVSRDVTWQHAGIRRINVTGYQRHLGVRPATREYSAGEHTITSLPVICSCMSWHENRASSGGPILATRWSDEEVVDAPACRT